MKLELQVVGDPDIDTVVYLRCSWCGQAITKHAWLIWKQKPFGRPQDVKLLHEDCAVECDVDTGPEDITHRKRISADKLTW